MVVAQKRQFALGESPQDLQMSLALFADRDNANYDIMPLCRTSCPDEWTLLLIINCVLAESSVSFYARNDVPNT